METSYTKETELINRINIAFHNCFEKPYRVTRYTENDPDDYDGEGESVEKFYENKQWEEVNYNGAGGYLISYLTEEALLYYLPEILKHILTERRPHTDFTYRFFTDFGHPEFWNSKMENLRNTLSCKQRVLVYEVCAEINSWENHYYPETKFIRHQFKC